MSLTLVAYVPSFLKQRHHKTLRQMVSLDLDLVCGSRAVEEGYARGHLGLLPSLYKE